MIVAGRALAGILGMLVSLSTAAAQEATRVPVLAQVAHPHNYYWREMYMPQLTAGPSAGTFSPDGTSVIYSMQGSLWRQALDTATAEEITAGPGYDFQPDWSPDGRHLVFTRQQHNALNLMLLDLKTGEEAALTSGGGVHLEPRWSPEGDRLAYVRTDAEGYFGIYLANIRGNVITAERPLVAGNVSEKYRYYYSAADHAINPSWSPDGKSIVYVTNPEVAWGSGGIWEVPVDQPEQARQLVSEETTWAARPQLASDGKRLLYSSYRGRQWHQLWITNRDGEYPLPVTFGDHDLWQPRWSPDDRQLLYVSNASGGLELVLHTFVGGATRVLNPEVRNYKRPMRTLQLQIRDGRGRALPARVSLLAADGRHYAPDNVLVHGDDHVDRATVEHENHYFHCPGECTVTVPEGPLQVFAMHGFEHRLVQQSLAAVPPDNKLELVLPSQPLPERFGSYHSADLHVHMNYGGVYRQTTATMAAGARAENLDIVYNLIVNKEERIPDIALFRTDHESFDGVTVYQAQEYHTSYWGHLGLLHLDSHFLTPDFSSYWHTGLASAYPSNTLIQDLARAQGAVTGYVHPFDGVPDPKAEGKLTHALPVDVALGKTDYLEVVAFANHENTAAVWYRFLNLGFPLAAGAGTDAMTNYASLRGPIGLNRIFLEGVEPDQPETLKAAIKGGRGFVSNGPLLGLLVNDEGPGSRLKVTSGESLSVDIALRSPVPVAQLELVYNGKVVATVAVDEAGLAAERLLQVPVDSSGWILLRAVNQTAHPAVQDLYTYATTNPVWIEIPGAPQRAVEDAEYFLAWLDRIAEHATAREDYNHDWEREEILDEIRRARLIYKELREQ